MSSSSWGPYLIHLYILSASHLMHIQGVSTVLKTGECVNVTVQSQYVSAGRIGAELNGSNQGRLPGGGEF